MKVLVESYTKFIKKRKRYFSSPILILDRAGFIQIYQCERDKGDKIKEIIEDCLRTHDIKDGHIVWRTVYNGWGFPWAQIWWNKKILDEDGNVITPNQPNQ